MPAPGDDIETRLSVVEGDLAELRKQLAFTSSEAAAARVLAAGADRDVSEVRAELRAHTQALNALRETQVDFSRRLDALEHRMDALEHRMDALEHRMDALEHRMDALEHRMDALEHRMGALEREFDALRREMREGFATLATGMAQITALLTNLDKSTDPE